jgi:two-component system, LytTR family, sensor kinase
VIARRRILVWIAVAIAWTLFGALSALQVHVRDLTSGRQTGLWSVFNIVYFYWAWALLTPIVVRSAPRIDDSSTGWLGHVALQIPRAAMALLAQTILYTGFLAFDGRIPARSVGATIPTMLIRHLAGNALTYVILVSGCAAVAFYQRVRARELAASRHALRNSELEATLARTQLSALQSQLQPHFLFNTLNMISTLVARREPVVANRAIARLGTLLRSALDATDVQEVSLDDEILTTGHYVEIVELRFGSNVRFTFDIEHSARVCRVPTLLLQPLIENAVRHGAGASDRPIQITVSAAVNGNALLLMVTDDGAGFDNPASDYGGHGLRNVRQRLDALYGPRASLQIANRASGGAVVTVTLPVNRIRAASGE